MRVKAATPDMAGGQHICEAHMKLRTAALELEECRNCALQESTVPVCILVTCVSVHFVALNKWGKGGCV